MVAYYGQAALDEVILQCDAIARPDAVDPGLGIECRAPIFRVTQEQLDDLWSDAAYYWDIARSESGIFWLNGLVGSTAICRHRASRLLSVGSTLALDVLMKRALITAAALLMSCVVVERIGRSYDVVWRYGIGTWNFWVFANVLYAAWRAQGSKSQGWRALAFIFGFPVSLLSYFAVKEGKERAYGVELPRRRS